MCIAYDKLINVIALVILPTKPFVLSDYAFTLLCQKILSPIIFFYFVGTCIKIVQLLLGEVNNCTEWRVSNTVYENILIGNCYVWQYGSHSVIVSTPICAWCTHISYLQRHAYFH